MIQLIISFTLAVLIGIAAFPSFAGLIDWEAHDKWKRGKLQEVLEEVKKNGSCKYFSAAVTEYDKNNDQVIDAEESKAIEEFLKANPPKP